MQAFILTEQLSAQDLRPANISGTASFKDIQLLGDALSVVQYVAPDHRDARDFVYGAVEGMAEALDRYSFFVPPEMISIFSNGYKEKYVGIGVHVARSEGGNFEIIALEPDGPAYKAGVRPKDTIMGIDGTDVGKMKLSEALKILMGSGFSPGSEIALKVLRKGVSEPIDFHFQRELIKKETVQGKAIGERYGYIRIIAFEPGTPKDFLRTVEEIEKKTGRLTGVVIDLRNNYGGDLGGCVELLRLFIASGTLAVLESKVPGFNVQFKGNNTNIFSWPVVIIQDEGTASSSELFSGSLKVNDRAVVIGSKSFGKGTFQSFIPLSDNSGLYITLGKFYLPDGSNVESIGIQPDVFFDLRNDRIIDEALETLKARFKRR